MIGADQFLRDKNVAWLILVPQDKAAALIPAGDVIDLWSEQFAGSCRSCDGAGMVADHSADCGTDPDRGVCCYGLGVKVCTNCRLGEHQFDIEVEHIAYGEEYTGEPVACGTTVRTLTVSVIDDMVIELGTPTLWFDDCQWDGGQWLYQPDGPEGDAEVVNLPPAAKDGLVAVQLLIHEGNPA